MDHTHFIQGFSCSRCNLAKAEGASVKTAVADIINSSAIMCNTATQFHMDHPVPTEFCVFGEEC